LLRLPVGREDAVPAAQAKRFAERRAAKKQQARMIKRIIEWNAARRRWALDHEQSWAGQDPIAPSGLTVFQERCEAVLCRYLSSRDVQFRDRQVIQGENERWIEGFVGDTGAKVLIYEDQVELSAAGNAMNLERWDADADRTHRNVHVLGQGHREFVN
jgi:hypothetical protein